MDTPTLDVIIPCYNAQSTLNRAVSSVLHQAACQRIILINDGSSDDTATMIDEFAKQFPNKIKALHLPTNGGVALARNWGVLHSEADLVAFLDADDEYQPSALDIVPQVFAQLPNLGLIRLKLIPINLADRYHQHPNFAKVWDIAQMTGAGNTVFRKGLFLACGGFPTDALFRQFGGEDGALGIALAESTMVGTLFGDAHLGVLNHCREGMHAQRLLDGYLFGQSDPNIDANTIATANAVSQRIKRQLASISPIIGQTHIGRRELMVQYAQD